jgi:hypothetical protein
MRNLKLLDIILNIFLPIYLGILIYLLHPFRYCTAVRNYIPDGLWAYALISSVLIIWDRKINILWITICIIMFLLFELFQYFEILDGTWDVIDIITYFVFSFLALITNKYILLLNNHHEKKH